MQLINNSALFALIVLLTIPAISCGEEKEEPSFIQAYANGLSDRLDAYQKLIDRNPDTPAIEERIKESINHEINAMKNWLQSDFAAVIYVDEQLPFKPNGSKMWNGVIANKLGEMRSIMLGIHEDLHESPSLKMKITLLKKCLKSFDKEISDIRRLDAIPGDRQTIAPADKKPLGDGE